jgi:hypothetical protein
MNQVMFSLEETVKKIKSGANLIIAGDEKLLNQLPAGQWIGGTSVYFIGQNGGAFSQDKLLVDELPDYVKNVEIKEYDQRTLSSVFLEARDNGFSIIILPFASEILYNFAMNGPNYPGFATKPLIGWVSGVKLEDIGVKTPKVFNGKTGTALDNKAVVLSAELPANKVAEIDIVNIFEQNDGDMVTFPTGGFHVRDVLVNGKLENFAEYLKKTSHDIKLPLVANYFGTKVNISIQSIDEQKKEVSLYAPVFSNIAYKLAKPIENYVKEFMVHLPSTSGPQIVFSCNCILNYLYSELEGKKTGEITGPVTFGEIAYQLLNQTMVYLNILDV